MLQNIFEVMQRIKFTKKCVNRIIEIHHLQKAQQVDGMPKMDSNQQVKTFFNYRRLQCVNRKQCLLVLKKIDQEKEAMNNHTNHITRGVRHIHLSI